MSKIICDVCGTTYPETATQCPICGCAKNTTAQTAAGEQMPGESGYSYVKGGRFSKSNVRKRTRTGADWTRQPAKPSRAQEYQSGQRRTRDPQPRERQVRDRQPKQEKMDYTNKILSIVIVLLLLAIVAVLCYIGIRVFSPSLGYQDSKPPVVNNGNNGVTESTGTTLETQGIPCTGLTITQSYITLNNVGDGYLLAALPTPENTTDEITFTSSDPAVATVSQAGLVKAVSAGQTLITATCGEFTVECLVVCTFGDASGSTENTEPPVPDVTEPQGFVLQLNRTDFSLTAQYPNPWALYKETDGVKPEDITWSVDDPTVAAVSEKGVVSAVGRGSTIVRATYGDQTVTCKVHVQFDPQPPKENKYAMSPESGEVTLRLGDANSNFVRIELSNRDTGAAINVEWTASDEGYVDIDGKVVVALKATNDLPNKYVTLTATVEGETYTFIIRIAEKED